MNWLYVCWCVGCVVDWMWGAHGSRRWSTATSKGIICVVTGDSSIKTAAANGGITKISHVDYHVMSVLGLYVETTVTVYGE